MIPSMPSITSGGNSQTNQTAATTDTGRRMQGLMMQAARPKDEFTFDYKLADLKGGVIAQAVTKAKTKQFGEDVLSPQIKDASVAVLGKITK
jgi:hypothetical protein